MDHMCGPETERGFNMMTASGKPYWPADPRAEDIRITDIAAHLSRICRYNGALRPEFSSYSVAQHSWLMSYKVPLEHALEALLHDAHEAYTGDFIKPVKLMLEDSVLPDLETLNDRVIRKKYGLPKKMTPVVKEADRISAATELRDVLPESHGVSWGDNVPAPWSDVVIRPLTQKRAETLFLQRFKELT